MFYTLVKSKPPLKFTLKLPEYATAPPQALVTKFWPKLIAFKLYILEAQDKIQTPLENHHRSPMGRLQCHHRPWWPNFELSEYILK